MHSAGTLQAHCMPSVHFLFVFEISNMDIMPELLKNVLANSLLSLKDNLVSKFFFEIYGLLVGANFIIVIKSSCDSISIHLGPLSYPYWSCKSPNSSNTYNYKPKRKEMNFKLGCIKSIPSMSLKIWDTKTSKVRPQLSFKAATKTKSVLKG